MSNRLILDTRRLFCRLLRTFEIDTVCDVGSMDGTDALRFRRALPRASILAFEPNPRNFALMEADEELRHHSIRAFPLAASDRRGEATFHVVEAEYAQRRNSFRRGMSSLHRRPNGPHLAETVPVSTVRLDEFLGAESLGDTAIALWIDTEGTAFEVVRGCSGILRSTSMLHVEVETKPVFGSTQGLFADVERELADAGFIRLATDQPDHLVQFNALFVRMDVFETKASEIMPLVRRERLRRSATHGVTQLLPMRLRLLLGVGVPETRLR